MEDCGEDQSHGVLDGDVCVPDAYEPEGGAYTSSHVDADDVKFNNSFYKSKTDSCKVVENKCPASAVEESKDDGKKKKDDIGATSLLVASSAAIVTAILTLVWVTGNFLSRILHWFQTPRALSI